MVAEVARREAGPQERVDNNDEQNENIDREKLYHGEWNADEAQDIPQGYLNVDNVNDGTGDKDWKKILERLGVEYWNG